MNKTLQILRKGLIILSIISIATFGAFAGGDGSDDEIFPIIIVKK